MIEECRDPSGDSFMRHCPIHEGSTPMPQASTKGLTSLYYCLWELEFQHINFEEGGKHSDHLYLYIYLIIYICIDNIEVI